VKKLAEVLQTSSVYLHTSYHEGFGLPILEAMACGCPVVTTHCNGNEEFCRDGENCLMADSVEDLVGAAKKIMSDKALAHKLSREALKTAWSYSWDGPVQRLSEYIKNKIFGSVPKTGHKCWICGTAAFYSFPGGFVCNDHVGQHASWGNKLVKL